ncbi:MAG: LuxR family transcriptional regulator, partial [Oscillochloris sp.]|nr:LuxR family transcriptional regulator [Oscillochloris sp.]
MLVTREDPRLPLARLRARDQLTELRAADLRFTPAEAATFLTQVMGLSLAADEIAALEARTEGWIAGLQLAALSMQGRERHRRLHHLVRRQPPLCAGLSGGRSLPAAARGDPDLPLRTSILDRLCGPLYDCVAGIENSEFRIEEAAQGDRSLFSIPNSQFMLEELECANLFIVPLDDERCWYRYHHLFGEILRQRLGQRFAPGEVAALHIRASQWYEDAGLGFDAFRHAAAANDVERAARLIERREMGLHVRSVAMAVLGWLAALPAAVLDARPQLRVRAATLALMAGQTSGVEERLQAAEQALQGGEHDAG